MRISTPSFCLFSSTLALLSTAVHGCGMFEHFYWFNLPDGVKEAAMDLGYDASSWRMFRSNPIELVSFKNLMTTQIENMETETGVMTSDDIKAALTELGLFDEDGVCWDFNINHYSGYTWAELADTSTPFGQNVQEVIATIGWDEMMWDDTELTGSVPESECKFWITLDPLEKWAYQSIGWNPITFELARCDPRCPKSLACPFN